MPPATEERGLILHRQRLSTEDGPGLRTTVFFKGCPLRCRWCHNPESLSPQPQVHWLAARCIGCYTCLRACPNGCLATAREGIAIDRARCDGCGACAEACPSGALELLGTRVGLDTLTAEALKDRAFYAASGGGVTVSGGEPALQAPFAAAFMARLRAAGVATALDTCGLCSPESLRLLLPQVDLLLFDLKEIDAERHRSFTGHDNVQILANLRLARDWIAAAEPGPALWIRTPLIPGATATAGNLAGIGRLIAGEMGGQVARWELCAFNNLCRDKYRRLDLAWDYADTPLLSAAELAGLADCARASGVDPAIVVAGGPTRGE